MESPDTYLIQCFIFLIFTKKTEYDKIRWIQWIQKTISHSNAIVSLCPILAPTIYKIFLRWTMSNSIPFMVHWQRLARTVHLVSGIKMHEQSSNHPNPWAKRWQNAVSMQEVKFLHILSVMIGRKDTNITIHRRNHSFSYDHVSMSLSHAHCSCNVPQFWSTKNWQLTLVHHWKSVKCIWIDQHNRNQIVKKTKMFQNRMIK